MPLDQSSTGRQRVPHKAWGSIALLSTAIFTLSACSPEDTKSSVVQRSQSVIGGTLSDRDPVVYVRSHGPDRVGSCTGTLIAPNLVITARHCVSAFTEGDYSCTIDGFLDLSRPRSPANAGDMGLPYPASDIAIHVGEQPDFDNASAIGKAVIAPESDTICRNDIAFVILENDIPGPVQKLRLDEGLQVNDKLTVVGYGINDARKTQRTERMDLPVIAIGASDFYEIEGNAPPRTFVVGTSVCPGDSGGPAIAQSDESLAGVFSLFRGDCQSSEARNFFTHVAPFRDLAREAFKETGHEELARQPSSADEDLDPAGGGAGGQDSTGDGKSPGSPKESQSGCTITSRSATGHPLGTAVILLLLLMYCARVRRKASSRSTLRC